MFSSRFDYEEVSEIHVCLWCGHPVVWSCHCNIGLAARATAAEDLVQHLQRQNEDLQRKVRKLIALVHARRYP